MEKSQRQHSAPHSGERRDEEVAVSGSTGGGTGGEDVPAHTQASGAEKEQLSVEGEELNKPRRQEPFHILAAPRPN